MSDQAEKWLPVVGYEGHYEVSDQGRVRSLDRTVAGRYGGPSRRRGTIRKQEVNQGNKSGGPRCSVGLSKDGKRRMRYVHHIVLEAFVGPRPPGTEACHADDDSTNNRLSNLRWDTHLANMADRNRNGIWPFHNRTHCKRGHEFTPENTGWQNPTSRKCNTCDRAAKQRYQVKKRAAEKAARLTEAS